MAERIPQSAAIRVGLQAFLASDHVTPATGLTIVVTISKNGAAYGNPSAGATNATEIANGSYYVDLSTTDTGTVGPLFVRGAVATMDPITVIHDVAAFSFVQTGDSFARIGAAGAGLTALGDTRIVNLDATVSSRSTFAGGAVASVTGAVGSVASYGTLVADVATAVWAAGTRSLTTFGTLVADAAAAVWASVTRSLTDKAGFSLTVTPPTAAENATAAAAQITTDHGAGSYVRNTEPPTAAATATAVRTELATELGMVDVAVSTRLATAGYTAPDNADIVAIKVKTDALPTDPADQSLIIAAADAIVAAVADKTGYRLSATGVNDIMRTALTEGYAAKGAAPTLEQMQYMLLSLLAERSILATVLTTKGLDGSTPTMTFDLDSATTPTAQTRAT